MVNCGCYLLVQNLNGNNFAAVMAGAAFVAAYAYIMSRVHRAPATIFLTTSIMPVIPGGDFVLYDAWICAGGLWSGQRADDYACADLSCDCLRLFDRRDCDASDDQRKAAELIFCNSLDKMLCYVFLPCFGI